MKTRLALILLFFTFRSALAQRLVPENTDYPNIRADTSTSSKTECVIAINPIDSLNLIASFMDEGSETDHELIYFSSNGGLSWNASVKSPSTDGSDPWLAFDLNGYAYQSCLEGSGVRLLSSTDRGRNWSPMTTVLNDGSVSCDEPIIAVDINAESLLKNSLYVAAVDAGPFFPRGIVLQYIRPDSNTHSSTIKVSHQQIVQLPHMAIGPTGTIYVSYIGITNISTLSGGLYFNKSTDGGKTFGNDKLIWATQYTDTVNGFPRQGYPRASRIGPTPRIAIDTSNGSRRGWLYACYAAPSKTGVPPALNILIQHSTDDGDTWSSPTRVNSDLVQSMNDHFTPSMAVNPDGTITVVYYDRRDDPNNLLVNAYLSISQDGGATFSDQRISTQSTNPLLAYSRNTLSIADYIGIAVSKTTVFPIWTDGRQNTGDLDIYTSRIPITLSSSVQGFTPQEQQVMQYSGGVLSISCTPGQHMQIILRDILGRELESIFDGATATQSNSFRIKMSNLANGIYFAELIIEGKRSIIKFSYIR